MQDNIKLNMRDLEKEKTLIDSEGQTIKIVSGNSKTKNDNLEKNIDEIGIKEGKNNKIISKEEEEKVREEIRKKFEKKEAEKKENEKKEKKKKIIENIQKSEEEKFKNKLEDKKNIRPYEPKDLFGKEYEKEEKEATEKAVAEKSVAEKAEDDEKYIIPSEFHLFEDDITRKKREGAKVRRNRKKERKKAQKNESKNEEIVFEGFRNVFSENEELLQQKKREERGLRKNVKKIENKNEENENANATQNIEKKEEKLEKFGHFVGNVATTIKGEIEKTPERLRKLGGYVVDEVKKIPSKLKKGVKNEINSKKKAFNSMFGLSGLRFKTDEEKTGNQNKFNSREEFLAWNSAQNFAKGLNDKIKSLRAKIGDKFSFLKFYKENDDEIDEILKRRPENSKFNDKGIEFFTYWDIEKLNGKNLNEYINKAQEHIENLKSYSKELDEFSKTHGIPMPDSDSKKYKNYYNNNDYDNNKSYSGNDLKTILIATGYFIKEIISKVNEKNKKELKEILTKNFYFNGSGQGSFKATGDIQKAINAGEDQAVDKFNEKIKEILKLSLNKDVKPLCSNSKVYEFFEKICKDGLDDIDDIEESDLENLKKYMAEQEKIN